MPKKTRVFETTCFLLLADGSGQLQNALGFYYGIYVVASFVRDVISIDKLKVHPEPIQRSERLTRFIKSLGANRSIAVCTCHELHD